VSDRSCPYCAFVVPDDVDDRDVGQAELEHMNEAHADVIEERLLSAGFRRDQDGEWVDTLVDG
jgi:hypothetical protein